ncbi:hypothetical protein C9374_007351 [Naegleria lovaniensis]|uniref:Uncharacterized protein n=1 Tax=Naegleria lovaniensis TaxID=51637 RepID=A0AA88KGH1_NAELO|nr:uncharacterized protein C9374_007351 [Naegleria lovaniensis]KAG2379212.1 hypothetical protein C9374_007351 [Naegleria lovaniensis]
MSKSVTAACVTQQLLAKEPIGKNSESTLSSKQSSDILVQDNSSSKQFIEHSQESPSIVDNNNDDGIPTEEEFMKKLQDGIQEYAEIDKSSRHSSDDELINFVKDKEEKLLFRLGRLLEKKKKKRKKELKRKRMYESEESESEEKVK